LSSCKEHEDDPGHDDALTVETDDRASVASAADATFVKRVAPARPAHAAGRHDARVIGAGVIGAGIGGGIASVTTLGIEPSVDAHGTGSTGHHRAASSDYTLGGADIFDRTFQIAATEAGLPVEALARHLPIFRRTVGAGQTVLLVARCGRLDQPNAADHLIVITRDRVVITSESRSLHRARLHLNAAVAALMNVRWQPDAGLTAVEFAATALDGVRERFLIEAPDAAGVSHVDAVLGYVFRPPGSRRLNPVDPVMPSWMNPAGAF
jgi:hypothetical protein